MPLRHSKWRLHSIQIMEGDVLDNYRCVNCGSSVKCLYRKYSPTVLILATCDNCGKAADKYVEYDDVIILIDIILFNKQAYRHLLFNTQFKNHWKLALLILILKTSDDWLCVKSSAKVIPCNIQITYEPSFYYILLVTALGKAVFFLIVMSFFHTYWNVPSHPYAQSVDLKLIWKAIISSSFGFFLLIPSLIWSDFQREIHILFIWVYILLSRIQALTVIIKIPRLALAVLLMVADWGDFTVTNFLRQHLLGHNDW